MVGGSDPKYSDGRGSASINDYSKGAADEAAPGSGAVGIWPPLSYSFIVNLPGEMTQYGPDIQRFVDAMIYKMEKNLHKGRWEEKTLSDAFRGLEAEVKELREELFDKHGQPVRPNLVKGLLECADVANFALIAAAIIMERGR